MRRLLIPILALSCVLGLTSCTSFSEEPSTEIFTDAELIKRILPKIYNSSSLSNVHFKESVMGNNDRTCIPGPTDYLYTGVITIDDKLSESIYSNYELKEQDLEFDDDIIEYIAEPDGEWQTSKEFISAYSQAYYGGNIYINGNQIYFEVSRT